jgi:hypothetical protein
MKEGDRDVLCEAMLKEIAERTRGLEHAIWAARSLTEGYKTGGIVESAVELLGRAKKLRYEIGGAEQHLLVAIALREDLGCPKNDVHKGAA